MIRNDDKKPCRRLMFAVSMFAAVAPAIGAHAQFNFDELSVSISPAVPTADETFDLRAVRWFGDTGQTRLDQSIHIEGNQIDVFVLMQNLHTHPNAVFPQVVTQGGAFLKDVGPLPAGSYHVNAEMWMTDWPSETGGRLLNTGSLTFSVVAPVSQEIIAGDYNGDGIVNAADYTLWRDALGSNESPVADGDGSGMVDKLDYGIWKTHFGQGAGSAATMDGFSAVPEPTSVWLVIAIAVSSARVSRTCSASRCSNYAAASRAAVP